MNKARQIASFDELFNQNGNELFLLSLNGDTHTMSLNTIKDFCVSESVTGGTYNQNTGTLTLSNNSGGSFTISGFKNDDITLTGGTYDNGTITFSSNNGASFSVDGLYTGYTAPPDIYVTGGTYDNGITKFTNSVGDSFDVTGFTIDRPSLSDLGFNITSLPTAVVKQDIPLPNDSYVTYESPLVIDAGYTLSVPPTSQFNIVTDRLSQTGVTSTANNISDAIYTVNYGLNANNTTTATTSVMVYGVNVFTGVTSTNYATKLPQPVTGKSVKVMNNGSNFLYIYPSNIGGQINNLPIDTPAIIPPDGNLYEFICIKNPLPGAWTFSAPATGQYDSGELSISISGLSQGGTNPVISAYDSASIGTTQTFSSFNWGFDGKNKPAILRYNSSGIVIAFRPETPWKGITKIKVYTNLVNSNRTRSTSVRLLAGGNVNYYSKNDSSFLSNGQSQDENELFKFFVNRPIGGNAVTASTIYTSANIGDAGTLWSEKIAFSDQYNSNVNLGGVGGTFIGNKDLDDVPYPYGQTWDDSDNEINTGDIVSSSYSSYISFQIQPFTYDFDYGLIPDFKFRFIIEYFQ